MQDQYIIETSIDNGETWRLKGRFQKGEQSRFNEPMDADVALLEAKSYKARWNSLSIKVRVIIEI